MKVKAAIAEQAYYYSIEFVRGNCPQRYCLVTKCFGSYRQAEQLFKQYCLQYPHEHITLDSARWRNTDHGYLPIAWHTRRIKNANHIGGLKKDITFSCWIRDRKAE
jgi:hypothetical protein